MQDIFKRIEGKEWDKPKIGTYWSPDYPTVGETNIYSLADLLSNASWCKAVWQKAICPSCKKPRLTQIRGHKKCVNLDIKMYWDYYAIRAFRKLQQEGEAKAIEYIKQTMV